MSKNHLTKLSLHSLFFLLILLLAALLRFYCLSCSSLWHDEGNTWALMGRSFSQIAQDAAADIHPPGYYWLLKLWTGIFGADVIGLRAFSAIVGVATVAVIYAIGRRIFAHHRFAAEFALLAALLAAANPFQIYYSQEARMYALLMLQSTALFWALLVMMAGGGRQAAGGRRQAAGSRQQAAGGRQQAVGSRQQAVGGDSSRFTHPVSRITFHVSRITHHVSRITQFAIRNSQLAIPVYFLSAASGLWTHYSFPVVLAAAGLVYIWHWLHLFSSPINQLTSQPVRRSPARQDSARWAVLLRFVLLNALVLLAFLPWLPTAIDRVLNWPAGGEAVGLHEGLRLTLQTLLLGPVRTAPDLAWLWLVVAGLLPLVGVWTLRRSPAGVALGAWLLAPILLMFALGLYTDAFLKFLLIASPAWVLLAVAGLQIFTTKDTKDRENIKSTKERETTENTENTEDEGVPSNRAASLPRRIFASPDLRRFASSLCAFAVIIACALLSIGVLPGYYADAAARDNYAGIARTVAALGDADNDLVLLAAPGQQEVWRYYAPAVPVLALPQQRPVDPQAVTETLAQATAGRSQIFALFWALDEADPDGVVERWLDSNAFKGLESWQGNVRFVVYSLRHQLSCHQPAQPLSFGELAQLSEICYAGDNWQVAAGENLLLGLRWQALATTDRRYKVTVQLLDERQQVIAQRDGEPAGGSQPTIHWQPGDLVVDNHALFVPPGTPPGSYRLILALYDAESGERLSVAGAGDFTLATVDVVAGEGLPLDIIPMQRRLNARLGPLVLAGYDAYRRDHAHAPNTPLQPGDLLHVTLFWRAPDPLPADWPHDLHFSLSLGDQTIETPLAGGLYPTGEWPPGAFVRGEFDILYTGGDPTPYLQIGGDRLGLFRIPK
jgi:mannosyltransferase